MFNISPVPAVFGKTRLVRYDRRIILELGGWVGLGSIIFLSTVS